MNTVKWTSAKPNGYGSFVQRYKFEGVSFTHNARGDRMYRVSGKSFRTVEEVTAYITASKGGVN